MHWYLTFTPLKSFLFFLLTAFSTYTYTILLVSVSYVLFLPNFWMCNEWQHIQLKKQIYYLLINIFFFYSWFCIAAIHVVCKWILVLWGSCCCTALWGTAGNPEVLVLISFKTVTHYFNLRWVSSFFINLYIFQMSVSQFGEQ